MPRKLRRDEYTIGWVCALPIELAAAQEMLDEEHHDLERDPADNDENLYALGSIGRHNVAIVCLPAGRIGNNPAATVATQMRATFKAIRFGLMVGIGGGVPSAEADVRLGDVVVSQPYKVHGGVVQYDVGKTTPSGFERTGSLNSPPQVLLSAIVMLRANEMRGRSQLSTHVSKLGRFPKFQRVKAGPDVLFEAAYDHVGGYTCDQCDVDRHEVRQPRESEEVAVYYGTIASGNQVMRSAAERDRLSAELGGVLCFEMEAAGLMDSFPCLVIRGICDYADSHKNKRWQPYEGGRDTSNAARARQPPVPVTAVSSPAITEDLPHVISGAEPPVSVSRILTEKGVSSYHGRTSTLFDENTHHDRPVATRPKMPEQWIENGLVAEAARQRQLEEYNLRRQTLDFDGVDPDLGMHLLNLHWNRQHHAFLVTYRPAFMRDMACGGPYFSKLLLNAIYFGAAKFSARHEEVRRVADDVRTAGWQFRKRVRQLLGEALDRSEITTIQALLVMTNSLFALGDERSAAWTYAGIAFRMIFDLGLHVDTLDLASASSLSNEDYEIRRRVFWAAFVVDKIQSLYQGRPVSIKESDTLKEVRTPAL
ncbi:hypothetical protein N0V95_003279 [Ascochyta clinopodiicola]|nr:hypothetical protein N0V95_003279 [Ascochyta clinopodiicola]